MEIWKPLPAFEGVYSVSSEGRVRRELTRGKAVAGDLLKPWVSRGGYLFVRLSDCERRICVQVHRLVMLTFVGPCPANQEVNHKNGIKTDPRFENLEYVTRSENIKHAIRLGLLDAPSNKGMPWKPPSGWVSKKARYKCAREGCENQIIDYPSQHQRFCSGRCGALGRPRRR